MKDTIRTFVAVELDAATRQRAAELIDHLQAASADVKWVATHNLHLTLKFLGDVPAAETARVCQAVQQAAAEVAPFELEMRGAGAFPHVGRPQTIWLGAGSGEDEMAALHKRVEAALEELGFPKEGRRFTPHLTIGRVRNRGPALARLGQLIREHADFHAGRSPVGELVVFSSQLQPGGPIYQALGRAALGGK